MQEKNLWDTFTHSGSVEDYLRYSEYVKRKLFTGKEADGEADLRGSGDMADQIG